MFWGVLRTLGEVVAADKEGNISINVKDREKEREVSFNIDKYNYIDHGYAATVHIDGNTVGTNGGTLNWTGGSAPSAGGASGVDIYAYTIMKTASSTYTVIATLTTTAA